MYCSKCGATVLDGVAFCPACGQPAAAAVMAPAAGMASVYVESVAARPIYYAGFWLRFVAYLLDVVAIWIVALPIYLLLGTTLGLSMSSIARNPDAMMLGSALGGILLFEGCVLVGVWLYYAFFESSAWQGTVGKKVLGLRVTDLEGNRISFGRATGRFFAKLVSNFTMMIGYIMAGFTERKQALHDMIAGCLVVKSV